MKRVRFFTLMLFFSMFGLLLNGCGLVEESTTDKMNREDYLAGTQAIRDKDWIIATNKLAYLAKINYKDSEAIFNYAVAKKSVYDNQNDYMAFRLAKEYMDKISFDYKGSFMNDIADFKKEVDDKLPQLKIAFNQELNKKAEKEAEENAIKPGSRIVKIGMTKNDAEISMGKPQKINRTVTSTITYEQWVYGNQVYLYFENGLLTAWQD